MFDKNSILAMFLVMLIMIGYSWYIQPTPEQIEAQKRKKDSIALAITQDSIQNTIVSDTTIAKKVNDTVPAATSTGFLGINSQNEKKDLVIENEKISCQISTLGARPHHVKINNFNNPDSSAVELFDHAKDKNQLIFKINDSLNNSSQVNTSELIFEVIKSEKNKATLRAYFDASKSKYLEYDYSLDAQSYNLNWNVKLVNMESQLDKNGFLTLQLENYSTPKEFNSEVENTYTTIYFRDNGIDYLSETESDEAKLNKPDWICFKQQFFNTTLISTIPFSGLSTSHVMEKDKILKKMKADLILNYEPSPEVKYAMKWYMGPNDYELLKAQNVGLQDIIPYGWKIFRSINEWIIRPLFNFLHKYFSNLGIVILILTIIIKLLVFPLTFKSYVASAKMKLLKPDIDKLKEKFKDEPQKLQVEQMKLQGDSGVSILGGCLPQLIQMPLWIALYRFFPATIDLRQAKFLWSNDLSNYDSIFHIGSYHVSLFCLLFCLSQLLMTWYMSRTTEIPDQMKYMQYFFPIMMFFFLNSTSSALNWYLFAGNIISMILQYISLTYIINHDKLKLEMLEKRKNPKKKSAFQLRMEEAMKQQEQARKKK